jgi:hypothetical protein
VHARATHASGRLFAWPATVGATFYVVQFFRDGRKIYEARPRLARLMLPDRWDYRGQRHRLVPGRYRWRVRAVSGTRSRPRPQKVVVDASLKIGKRAGP